ncbi:MAG: radical SAM family heme chaperone HemW [Paracoccaceae bacterium]
MNSPPPGTLACDWRAGGFGLYLHWPFCAAKCPYCDFNSHVAAAVDQRAWAGAYLAEIVRVGALTAGRALDSVFFGGGTPSLMEPALVAEILDAVRRTWTLGPGAEVTMEANPTSVEAGRFRAYAAAGVNRLSLGIQALNDPDLRRLGRMHSAAEARAAFDVARAAFGRVSFDLIYARQGQSPEAWAAELREAAAMAVDHLSVYQLTIEPGTAFADRLARGGLRGLPDDDAAADMYMITQDILDTHGLPAYEVSNHARAGAEGRHNLVYWRSGDFAGIGPGAHGRLTLGGERIATEAERNPAEWLRQVGERGSGEILADRVPLAGQSDEYLLMGLRLTEGIDAGRYARLAGRPLPEGRVAALAELGMLTVEGARVRPTAAGRAVLNAVIRELAAD